MQILLGHHNATQYPDKIVLWGLRRVPLMETDMYG